MPDANEAARPQPDVATEPPIRFAWVAPALRVAIVLLCGVLVWYIAGHWNRWTGAARFEATNDAYTAGDVTPLAAKVSGYIAEVAVGDFQQVRKGDLIVQIEPSDYRAQLLQAAANQAAAQAALANLANQKDVQRALIRQAEATIQATSADVQRYDLEAKRQRDLLQTRIAGTAQAVEQADANAQRTMAQKSLNEAQLDQQKAVLASLDVQQNQLQAQVAAAQAQLNI
jgi:membrane fusion protein (multidrug efflux system)